MARHKSSLEARKNAPRWQVPNSRNYILRKKSSSSPSRPTTTRPPHQPDSSPKPPWRKKRRATKKGQALYGATAKRVRHFTNQEFGRRLGLENLNKHENYHLIIYFLFH